jgi:sulfur-carrier protein
MAVTVFLSGHLKTHTEGAVEVILDGEFETAGDVLASLWEVHPALRDRVLDEQGEVRTHVNIFVGGKNVKQQEGLATRVNAEELHIFNAVSGG